METVVEPRVVNGVGELVIHQTRGDGSLFCLKEGGIYLDITGLVNHAEHYREVGISDCEMCLSTKMEENLSEDGLRMFLIGTGNARKIPFEFDGTSYVRDVFIETGIDSGQTTIHALRSGFKKCHTIDINPNTFRRAKLLFAKLTNIYPYLGDSRKILPTVINPDLLTTFWLDAHSCGRDEPLDRAEDTGCPLEEELRIITSFEWKHKPLIMIDDAGGVVHNVDGNDWPTLKTVASILHDYNLMLWTGGEHKGDTILFCHPK